LDDNVELVLAVNGHGKLKGVVSLSRPLASSAAVYFAVVRALGL
jgi:hypothetical protein